MNQKYNVESVLRMTNPEYVFFWKPIVYKTKIRQSCLCQWWKSDFVIDGITYNCAEQYMMSQKALLFGDKATYDKIMLEDDPAKMKKLGRKVANYDIDIWDKHKYEVVVRGNYAKFSQNDILKRFLVETGNAVLVEASPYDTVWGVGLKQSDKDIRNPNLWRGTNLLGFAIMEVRDSLMVSNNFTINTK